MDLLTEPRWRMAVASRLVTDMNVPVAAWRAAMCHTGRRGMDCDQLQNP